MPRRSHLSATGAAGGPADLPGVGGETAHAKAAIVFQPSPRSWARCACSSLEMSTQTTISAPRRAHPCGHGAPPGIVIAIERRAPLYETPPLGACARRLRAQSFSVLTPASSLSSNRYGEEERHRFAGASESGTHLRGSPGARGDRPVPIWGLSPAGSHARPVARGSHVPSGAQPRRHPRTHGPVATAATCSTTGLSTPRSPKPRFSSMTASGARATASPVTSTTQHARLAVRV